MMSFVTRLTFAWKVWSGDETIRQAGGQGGLDKKLLLSQQFKYSEAF